MPTLGAPVALSLEKNNQVRWKRVVLAAFLSEVFVLAVLSAAMAIHRFVIAPDGTAAQYQEFALRAGYYLAAPAAALGTFMFAFWATRRLESGFITNGVLVGAVATLLTVGFIFGARPEDRLMYVVSYALRIVAGYAGGVAAQKGVSNDYTRQVR
jgi:hypothetical protein